MKECLKLLTNYLFKEIGVTKITAEVMLENISSIKLLESIGFVQERIEKLKYKKKDGMFTDVVIMSIIDKDNCKSLRTETNEVSATLISFIFNFNNLTNLFYYVNSIIVSLT